MEIINLIACIITILGFFGIKSKNVRGFLKNCYDDHPCLTSILISALIGALPATIFDGTFLVIICTINSLLIGLIIYSEIEHKCGLESGPEIGAIFDGIIFAIIGISEGLLGVIIFASIGAIIGLIIGLIIGAIFDALKK
ncbi:MAG: hypothetical protein LBM93_06215 [Oscillospiraceae bacterium]|jgi:hypothetical protein|nr:hypothetical protein [Oscillospiraceae bacterium]